MKTTVSLFLIHAVALTLIGPPAFWTQDPVKESAHLPETWARKAVLNAVMPIYSEEAVRRGISGVVRIKIETTPEGDMATIKVNPHIDSLLQKAVVDVLNKWKFKPFRGPSGLDVVVYSRLNFNFIIENGAARVEMFDPGPNPPAGECLGCVDSAKELREWEQWKEAWSKTDELSGHRP